MFVMFSAVIFDADLRRSKNMLMYFFKKKNQDLITNHPDFRLKNLLLQRSRFSFIPYADLFGDICSFAESLDNYVFKVLLSSRALALRNSQIVLRWSFVFCLNHFCSKLTFPCTDQICCILLIVSEIAVA